LYPFYAILVLYTPFVRHFIPFHANSPVVTKVFS
jgi:hypothetical protein